MTIAFALETESDLRLIEDHHICPEKALSGLLAQEMSIVSNSRPN